MCLTIPHGICKLIWASPSLAPTESEFAGNVWDMYDKFLEYLFWPGPSLRTKLPSIYIYCPVGDVFGDPSHGMREGGGGGTFLSQRLFYGRSYSTDDVVLATPLQSDLWFAFVYHGIGYMPAVAHAMRVTIRVAYNVFS